jgi:hypothetical protein
MAPVALQEILDASRLTGAEHTVVHLAAAAELARGVEPERIDPMARGC